MSKLDKPSEYRNCFRCDHREECWSKEAYGQGYGKKPWPKDAVCMRFECKKGNW